MHVGRVACAGAQAAGANIAHCCACVDLKTAGRHSTVLLHTKFFTYY
jgi:hypothetical protein